MKKLFNLLFIVTLLFTVACDKKDESTCSDGKQNQGETGVDCGGPCTACAAAATCNDGIQNQGETSVDCGGPCAICTQTLEGNLTTQTLTADKKYLLKGLVYINDGVTVTIEEGVTIFGDKASKASLVVNRGGKLIANGSAAKPIVFTSNAPEGYRNYGDWGGIILCGKAPNNQSPNQIMEGPSDFNNTTTMAGSYGGTTSNDNSGSLKYIRLEFGGISYAPDKEINGLTLCSVGSGTTLEHIQVTYSGDDAFEWFGGAVNAKYLVAFKAWDDDFDTDFGYAGKVQFAVSMRDLNIADKSASNGFESDNDAAGSTNTPLTTAQFSNVTIMGPHVFNAKSKNGAPDPSNVSANYGSGMHVRRNSNLEIYNSIVAGYPQIANFDKTGGALKVKYNHFQKYVNVPANGTSALFTAGNSNDTTGLSTLNTWGGKGNVANLFADTTLANGNPIQKSGSPALSGANFTNLTDPFFTTTTYKGAMGTSPDAAWDWTSGWLNFAPENKTY